MVWLEDDRQYVLGRGEDCGLQVRHGSVSRKHLRLELSLDSGRLHDLGSKNGTRVDGQRVELAELRGMHWLEVGEVSCQLEVCSAEQLEQGRRRQQSRIEQSRTLGDQVAAAPPADVLQQSLEAVAQLAECDRAAILLPDGDQFRVAAALGARAASNAQGEFIGSRSALQRALTSGLPVVVNDIRVDATLSRQQSVVSAGLHCLLVLPLQHEDEVVGLIYADRRNDAQPIPEFDLSLVNAFAERAAVWLAARRSIESLDALPALAGDREEGARSA